MEAIAENRPRLIVRPWGNEPVAMFLHDIDNKRVYVFRQSPNVFIGLPFEHVFVFDEAKFSTAREAFIGSDKHKLASSYLEMENYPCNRS